jgi:hypothetical protein
MESYEQALRETSRPGAPWYAIPADDKPNMRVAVAEILVETLKSLDLRYPSLSQEESDALARHRRALLAQTV